jgi:demethylsterigmatocystin 6-O-methyltransferase
MRGVLHDFPDDKCQLILSNIAAAMSNDSVLLIDEMVLPDRDIHWQAASMDLQMLSYLGSQERTRSHWSELTRPVGLSIENVHVHNQTAYESLLVLVKDQPPKSC